MKVTLLFYAFFIFSAVTSLLPGVASADAAPRLRVVSTIGMIGDIVTTIGEDSIENKVMIGAGVDPHLYKATRSDILMLRSADVIFYNGLLLEGKILDALERVKATQRPVVPVAEVLDSSHLLAPEEFEGSFDPHVWMDPVAWSKTIQPIVSTLSKLQPQRASDFARRGDALSLKLQALAAYAESLLGTVPAERRVLVTAHDAFNYFGRRFNFEVVGIQGISTESEAGVRDIQELVTLLVTRRIPSVFVESTVSEKNIRALIEGAAAQGHTVSIGGELYSDAMGAPGTPEGTYVGMIEHNVQVITRGLGGKVDRNFIDFERAYQKTSISGDAPSVSREVPESSL